MNKSPIGEDRFPFYSYELKGSSSKYLLGDTQIKDAPGYYGITSSAHGECPQGTVKLSEQTVKIRTCEENLYYFVKGQIGEGSHSTIWLAQRDEVSGPHLFTGPACIKRSKEGYESKLVTEYSLLSIINHPTIINPWDFFRDGESLNMVLPYYPKSAYALRGKCDMLTVWRFCECISGALEHLHDLGIVHNDVKLSNILVDNEGRFILSDLSAGRTDTNFEIDDIGFGRSIMELVTGRVCFLTAEMPKEMIVKELDAARIRDILLRKLIIRCLSRTLDGCDIPSPGYLIQDTDFIQWTYVNDFAIVQQNNKYGLINRFGNVVIPIEYDTLSQVGLLSIPGPGPGAPPEMRCLFKKADKCGSFLIDKDYATLELEISQEEWQNRAMWT